MRDLTPHCHSIRQHKAFASMKAYQYLEPLIQLLRTALWLTIIFFIVHDSMSVTQASSADGSLQAGPSAKPPLQVWQLFTCEKSISRCWIGIVDPRLVCDAENTLAHVRSSFRALPPFVQRWSEKHTLAMPTNWILRQGCHSTLETRPRTSI
jgi:hypothetical protein